MFIQHLVFMAMSFCSIWDSPQLGPTELTEDLFGLGFDINEFSLSDCLVLQSDELFYSNILPCFETEYCHLPCFETEHCHYPKRQKSYVSQFDPNFTPNLCPNPDPGFILPQIQAPVTFNCGSSGEKKKNGGSISGQSIAARERRRKITEKTQELGKLIPGGSKMNTAEMFQAASNYVKFLQAQVSILELVGSCQEMESVDRKEVEILVTSSRIQEKLWLEEKCLVPIQFVGSLVDDLDHELELKPLI